MHIHTGRVAQRSNEFSGGETGRNRGVATCRVGADANNVPRTRHPARRTVIRSADSRKDIGVVTKPGSPALTAQRFVPRHDRRGSSAPSTTGRRLDRRHGHPCRYVRHRVRQRADGDRSADEHDRATGGSQPCGIRLVRCRESRTGLRGGCRGVRGAPDGAGGGVVRADPLGLPPRAQHHRGVRADAPCRRHPRQPFGSPGPGWPRHERRSNSTRR